MPAPLHEYYRQLAPDREMTDKIPYQDDCFVTNDQLRIGVLEGQIKQLQEDLSILRQMFDSLSDKVWDRDPMEE